MIIVNRHVYDIEGIRMVYRNRKGARTHSCRHTSKFLSNIVGDGGTPSSSFGGSSGSLSPSSTCRPARLASSAASTQDCTSPSILSNHFAYTPSSFFSTSFFVCSYFHFGRRMQLISFRIASSFESSIRPLVSFHIAASGGIGRVSITRSARTLLRSRRAGESLTKEDWRRRADAMIC